MKKKTIEKISYIGLQRVCKKKGAKYVGATAVKIIGGEKHLITEVYKNEKGSLAVPLVRIVLTEKDYGIYLPDPGEWKKGRIEKTYRRYLIWEEGCKSKEEKSVLRSEEDLQRIKSFPGIKEDYAAYKWREWTWYEIIDKRIGKLTADEYHKRVKRERERRRQALKEREENTPELPEEKILEYADRKIFHEKHYLFYKKQGVRVRVACTECGGVREIRWKPGISYESQFEPMIEEPRKGHIAACPICGARGEWYPQGNVKSFVRETARVFIGQRYKERGMVFRYIELEKEYKLGLIVEDGGPVMENACEEISGIEIARAYFEEGKKTQTDYHKSSITGDFWDDCNLYGMNNIRIDPGWIYENTWEEMKGTFLQYSGMKEFEDAERTEGNCINPIRYAEEYIRTPQIEMLTKLGLIKVVEKLARYEYGIVKDLNANRVDKFLGIRKERVRQLIRHQGDEKFLRVMKFEKDMGERWSDKQIENLAEISQEGRCEWIEALKYMGVQKLLNLISRYAGAEYGTGCDRAESRLRETVTTYIDYLGMRESLGYDMSNTVYLMPRDLNRAHQKMIAEQDKEKTDQKILKAQKDYPMIKKHYRRLRNKFYYEDENFCIRPARDAKEIIMEGRILHHCVGRDSYLTKHNNDITTILFLRRVTEPDIPYITVEIGTNDLKLMQWYGAHDKKPDKDNMDQWLNIYLTKLRCGLIGAQDEAGEAAGQPLAMLA